MSSNEDMCNMVPKPAIEKRRRERMNASIKTLRGLIGETITRNTSPLKRVDKADVLELTVKHIQQQQQQYHHQQQQQTTAAMVTQRTAFDAGFQDCMKEVIHFTSSRHLTDPNTLQTLSNYLNEARMGKTVQRMPVPYFAPISTPSLGIYPRTTATISSPAAAIAGVLSPSRNKSADYNRNRMHPYMLPHHRSIFKGNQTQQNMACSSFNSTSSSMASFSMLSPSREETSGESDNSNDTAPEHENDVVGEDKENNDGQDGGVVPREDDNERHEQNVGARENVNLSAMWRPW